MKKYQQLAQQLTEQIALGVWLPGDRLPSLREQVISLSLIHISEPTRLGMISYAVFCLKKKKKNKK